MQPTSPASSAASANITKRIEELGDWRGDTLAHVRKLIHAAVPGVVEEWKWRGTPVWAHDGGICTGESYKQVVKLTFHRGAALADPKKLFNASLEGNVRRAIDFREGEKINEAAFTQLIRAAVAANAEAHAGRASKAKPAAASKAKPATAAKTSVSKTSVSKAKPAAKKPPSKKPVPTKSTPKKPAKPAKPTKK